MKFDNMLIKKYSDNSIKLINMSNGDEAVVNNEYLCKLMYIAELENLNMIDISHIQFVKELTENLSIKISNGKANLNVRSGSFENLDIHLTNSCNISCKHCCVYDERQKTKVDIDCDLLIKAVNDAISIGLTKMYLSGGEPFTYNYINKLISFVNNSDVRSIFVSNGLLIDKYISEIDFNKASFIISLDGFKTSHDQLRGCGTYDKTLSNIKYAISIGFDVEVNMVVYDDNIEDVEAFAIFVKDLGVSRLNIQSLRLAGMARSAMKCSLIEDESFLRKVHQNELSWQMAKVENNKPFCTACETGLYIDHNADVFGCTFITEIPTGNLKSAGLIDIYKKGLLENPLFNVTKTAKCYSCDLFMEKCAGGCRARAQKLSGSINECDYWMPFLLNDNRFSNCGRLPHEFLLI